MLQLICDVSRKPQMLLLYLHLRKKNENTYFNTDKINERERFWYLYSLIDDNSLQLDFHCKTKNLMLLDISQIAIKTLTACI